MYRVFQSNTLRRVITTPLILSIFGIGIATAFTGCGTLIYPERKGQPLRGQLDTSIILLDAIGLLFFVIPGAVAFAIDYSNGTLFLPGGDSVQLKEQELKALSLNGHLRLEGHTQVLKSYLAESVDFETTPMQVRRLNDPTELTALELLDE